ncbi:hypothetical protein [Chryseolinea soli]|uniref:Uncharacterized protein n=1 Tax=Chryseolinea soli TaxID=2321403 RepID=A0A385SY63_9BACT|nr:hypothetical protein [Chryseolinea soli]AYB35005.1 hypothetical protein D4L85_32435 [Chryseolinea soli]
MIKKITFPLLGLLGGFGVGIWTEFWIKGFIHDLFTFFTDNHIRFHGKIFRSFFEWHYLAIFALIGLFCYHAFRVCTLPEKIKYAGLAVSIFFLALALICYADSYVKIIECTACDDGVRTLEYSDIRYERIIFTSLALSLLPIGIKRIRSQRAND